jgi:hypothetical protein
MRSNSPLHKTEPGALAYEHSFDARVRDVSKPALARQKARVLAMLGLAVTDDPACLQEMFDRY